METLELSFNFYFSTFRDLSQAQCIYNFCFNHCTYYFHHNFFQINLDWSSLLESIVLVFKDGERAVVPSVDSVQMGKDKPHWGGT